MNVKAHAYSADERIATQRRCHAKQKSRYQKNILSDNHFDIAPNKKSPVFYQTVFSNE
jgi:hypothetical protein